MNADPEDDAAVLGHAGVALDHGVLNFDGAAHGVDHAAEFDDRAVAGALNDAPMMDRDRRVDQIAAQRPQPREDAVFVGSGEARSRPHPSKGSPQVSGSRSSRPSHAMHD